MASERAVPPASGAWRLAPVVGVLMSAWRQVAPALSASQTAVRAAVDGWDVFLLISAAMLFAGLTVTFHVGIALMVVGILGLVFGLAGARGAELGALLEAKRKGTG